jgi:DNA (cytosine-5)-methyltransferase 1
MIKLLDICCGGGGAAIGYAQAAAELGLSIEITGVDLAPQPNYPFTFVQADGVEYLRQLVAHGNPEGFTHIHSSPPCQEFSVSTYPMRKAGKQYPNILPEVQALVAAAQIPAVIENVPLAPIRADVVLRGDMFGLRVLRRRHFELHGWFMLSPCMPAQVGTVQAGDYATVAGTGSNKPNKRATPYKHRSANVLLSWQAAMDSPLRTRRELAESIPPAYTRYIGRQFFRI